MSTIQNEEELGFKQLIATLARLQGIPEQKQYSALEVVGKQITILKRVIAEGLRSRNAQTESLRKKMDSIEEDMNQELGQAQNFANELEKSLKETERECKKRIQKMQKDKLQREIQIKTTIDERILQIVEGNKEMPGTEDNLDQLADQLHGVEDRLKQTHTTLHQFILQIKLESVETNTANQTKITRAIKQRQHKTKELKQRIATFQQQSLQKINLLRDNRCRIESMLLAELQKITTSLH